MKAATVGPAILLLTASLGAGCNRSAEPAAVTPITLPAGSPEEGALALFRFASTLNADSTLPADLVRSDLVEEYGADLLDLLEPLVGASPPRILAVELFSETDRAAVDVEFDLPGEGFSTWSVQLEQGDDEGWRLVWVQGPGDGWPPRKKQRGESLSSSEEGGPG
ncbi:MAG: hypothetical protein IFK94_12205 [Acidobacteria bacterium]|uniref:DUF4864 domain-containing protein n=1 Tax=Candidatus Polarisedimenticola svalbardensis TaxID=2886004 RepID=A0A8J7C357_9BACT|nr:hypothetical protein [Candidatus Polarisedimenticola svalbardensis]